MNMKKILQAMDGISTKPVEGAESMAKFLRVVDEAAINQDIDEDVTSPRFMGYQKTQHDNGDTTDDYDEGPLRVTQRRDAKGNVVSNKMSSDLGVGKATVGQENGITSKEWQPNDPDGDVISNKDMYALGNKSKEATYNRAMAQVNKTPVQENSLNKFLSIVRKNDVSVVKEADINQPTTKTPPAKPTSDLTADEMAAILSGQKTQAQVMADRAANKKETILDEPVALKVNPNSTNADTDRINNNQPDVDPNAPPGFSDDDDYWDPELPDDAEHVKSVEIMRNRGVNGQDTTDYDRYHYSRKNDGKPGVWTKNDQHATVRETMDKFLSIVKKNDVSILNEGASPHKVALPVQMAMQHYQQVKETPQPRERLIDKYFVEAEADLVQQKEEKRALYNQYAKTIAERVLMKESAQVVIETPIEMTGDANDPHIYGHEKANPMSLKGRIASARAQLKELAELAESDSLLAWEEICKKAKGGMFMGLEQNLEQIRHGISELAAKRRKGGVASRGIDKHIGEGKRK